jgi:hypothetical protein
VVIGAVLWRVQAPAPRATPRAEPAIAPPLLRVHISAAHAPVANAVVNVVSGHCRRQLTSDDSGNVAIDDCPPDKLRLTTEAPGHLRDLRTIELKDDDLDVDIELQPGARLAGHVRDDTGKPVASATVSARAIGVSGQTEPWTTLSASDGAFAFDTLPPASIVLEISDGGAHETTTLAEVAVPSADLAVMVRRTSGIGGRVLGLDKQPAASARITLAGSGVWPARTQTSDAHGAFEFTFVPEGVYEVRAELGSAISAPLEGISVQPGKPARLEVLLQPSVALTGSVRDAASGEALAGAELEISEESLSAPLKRARTGPDGRFSAPGLRAQVQRVTIRAPHYVTAQRWLTPGPTPVTLELLRAASLRGRVEDAAGRPVGLADIEISGRAITGYEVHMVGPVQEAPARDALRLIAGADAIANLGVTEGAVPRIPLAPNVGPAPGDVGFHSDENGNFRLDGVPPGTLQLIARKADYGSGRSQQLQVRPGATLDDIVISMPRGQSIEGRVEDAHGGALAHVRVDLGCNGEPIRSTTTRADGGFVFEGARGDCTVSARAVGAPAAKLTGGADELARRLLTLRVENATEQLVGRVIDQRGQPVESATVHLELPRNPGFSETAVTAGDGSFELEGLPAPPYSISVDHPDYLPVQGMTVSTADRLQVRLETGTGLSGSVIAQDTGLPPPSATVMYQASQFRRSVRTQRDGSFTFRHVPSGAYWLTIEADGYVPERRSGPEPPLDAQRITLTRSGSVSGDVVDRLGSTVWNAEVTAGDPPRWDRAVRTNHAGHFVLRGLDSGDHRVSARAGGEEVSSSRPIRVVAGEETPGTVLRLPGVVDDESEPEQRSADASGSSRVGSRVSQLASFGMRGGAVVVERTGIAGERSGLEVGDVLLRIDGEPVRSAAQARGMLATVPGRRSTWTLDVRRSGGVHRLQYSAR